jgi:hypothetical protein
MDYLLSTGNSKGIEEISNAKLQQINANKNIQK